MDDEPDRDDEELGADEFDAAGGGDTDVTIEIAGLSLYTHLGVSEAEREVGQRLVIDLRLEVGDCDAILTDRVEDTIDYAEVCEAVALTSQQRSYRTLERLCAAEDQTPSQVVRRLIREYIEKRTGKPWAPGPTKKG